MKLRIRGDSLRFRLTQGEASLLLAGSKVSEAVHFSGAKEDVLTYSLESDRGSEQLTARFAAREICVSLPDTVVNQWANSDQVGIESTQPIGEGTHLHIIIEKDFRCLQPRPEEDEHDNFPHPDSVAEKLQARAGPEN